MPCLVAPIERIKVLLQVYPHQKFRGQFHCLTHLIRYANLTFFFVEILSGFFVRIFCPDFLSGFFVWISFGSKYSNRLNTELVRYSFGRFVSNCQMVRYSNCGLKTRLKKACLWSEMSSIQMVDQVMWLHHLNTGHPYCRVLRWLLYTTSLVFNSESVSTVKWCLIWMASEYRSVSLVIKLI